MSEFPCLISDTRVCKPNPPRDLVFIIGSGSSEFKEDLEVVKEVLKGFGFKGYFALLSEEEKGLDAFCDKICSKILDSLFCVVMLNDPISLEYIDKASKEEKTFRAPRANVYYEFGMAIALRKRVIPIMRKHVKLPFNVQHLDAIPYESLDDLKEKLTTAARETLVKASRERIVKMPRIGLLLIDEEGNASNTINVQPIIVKIKYVERKEPLPQIDYAEILKKMAEATQLFAPRIPDKDLVPIRIQISNDGELPAQNINVFLEFPEECELVEKKDAIGSIFRVPPSRITQSGLYIDGKDEKTARAWLARLGNDLVTNKFDEIYVRFPTEEEKEYKLDATVIQDNYPPTFYEFKILVEPKIVEETQYKIPE